jgi:hypothetical protein
MAGVARAVDSSSEVPGTYELVICKSTCSFAEPGKVFATAVIVLFDHALVPQDLARIAPFYRDFEPARACFTVKRNFKAQSYVGIQKSGATPWQLRGSTLEFRLFQSPDAWYLVKVQLEGEALVGKGESGGAGVAHPGYSADTIVGRRRGPPDISACKPDAESSAVP